MQTDNVIDHIVTWLISYCDSAELNGFVVGVSGGIDSAVTSTLCAKTGKNVIALNMPIYQEPAQVSFARNHIQWLVQTHDNVRGVHQDLTQAFKALETVLPADIQDALCMANTRSRLRMLTLYAYATHHRMLVAGTGNKVEDFGVGFFTKYGDGGVDLSPIADLMKSEVYLVGGALGIAKEIMNAAPTDGLWDDRRTDESQIGATYDELEWAMRLDADGAKEEALDDRQQEVLSIYRRFHRMNRHKMVALPVCRIPEALRG
jgi:NAD+ synthase